ncbi:MAG: hypothetical protein V1863_00220 [Candidatus Omnitrophota bacterium]
MASAKLGKQVFVGTGNQVGEFAQVSSVLADANVNITGICAWGQQDKAFFALLTDNNAAAIGALKSKGLDAKEQDVVLVMLEDKLGAAKMIAEKIKKSGISLDAIYGTTCGCKNSSAMLILISKENAKLASCLNA